MMVVPSSLFFNFFLFLFSLFVVMVVVVVVVLVIVVRVVTVPVLFWVLLDGSASTELGMSCDFLTMDGLAAKNMLVYLGEDLKPWYTVLFFCQENVGHAQ